MPNIAKISHRLFLPQIAISILIFLAIIPLASQDFWWEGAICAVVFAFTTVARFLRNDDVTGVEIRQLLIPLYLLALYSFSQGFITILLNDDAGVISTGFISFDSISSIWGGFKILAFTLFLALLFTYFRQRVRFLTWGLVLTGNLFAVFGVIRFLLQNEFPELFAYLISAKLTPGVGFGTYFNQNHFAYLMLMVFGLNISLLRYAKLPRWLWLLLAIASLTTWTALVLTASRGGIIGSFVEITVLILLPGVIAFTNKRKRSREVSPSGMIVVGRQLASVVVIFVFLVVGIVLIGQDRVVGRFEGIQGQIGGITNAETFRRTDVWDAAVSIIRDHPFFGVGFGGFQFAVPRHIDISGHLAPQQSHNDYLELAASGGIIAVALGIWFLFRFFSLAKKRFTEPSDSFSNAARVGAICGIAGIGFHSFFDFGLQISANVLFFAALLFIAVHESQHKAEVNDEKFVSNKGILLNSLSSIPFLILAFMAIIFGFVKYQTQQAQTTLNLDFTENDLYSIPFDADHFKARSAVYRHAGNAEAAENELRKAVYYRPMDYSLWLLLANLQALLGHSVQADKAFQRSIELAPLYAEPHLLYGKFLIAAGRKEQGFALIRFAALRNPLFFDQILQIAWAEKSGDTVEIINLLSPLDISEKEKLLTFLSVKGDFAAIAKLGCSEDNLSDNSRYTLVKNLIDKRRYLSARQIEKKSCEVKITGEIEDGSFEGGKLPEGIGFGWRFQSSEDNTTFAFDKGSENGGGKSLRLNFDGKEDAFALISQIVVVENMQDYNLTFSYKTSGIVTGGVPVLQIILQNPDSEVIVNEFKFSLEDGGWVKTSLEFASGKLTEAVEIRLIRQACPESICPIFGNLWLDNFDLRKSR